MSLHGLVRISLMVILIHTGCGKVDIGPSTDCSNLPSDDHPKAALFQTVLDDYVQKGLPGITALVRDDSGTWVGASGRADISKGINMKPCMVSKAASITKTFIGALTLKLVEEGKLGLDDPLSMWLPREVSDEVRNANLSTVRMLLNHTTGIADLIDDNSFYLAVLNDPDRRWTPSDLIKFVYGEESLFEAGTDVSYSNTNFLLLAMILDSVTKENHSIALRNKIIAPLGLTNTYYYWHDEVPPATAQGYFDLYNNGTIQNMTNYNTGSGNGYGGLYSNVYDLQVFIEALVRERTILSAPMLSEMLQFTKPEADVNRANGLGIFKDFLERAPDEYAYGHRGRDLGYTADMYWFPVKDRTMVYFVNYGTDANSSLREVFFDFRKAMTDIVLKD